MNNEKKCIICKEVKNINKFYNYTKTKDGKRTSCIACYSINVQNYSRSKLGLITRIYKNQQIRSKIRNHQLPNYTLKQLKEWINLQSNFDVLYDNWIKNNYKRDLTPSIDRLDDYKPYNFNNIRMVTWKENHKKYHNDALNGINNKTSKQVSQYTKKGIFIKSYYSISNASRETGVDFGNISKAANGILKTSGGFIWK